MHKITIHINYIKGADFIVSFIGKYYVKHTKYAHRSQCSIPLRKTPPAPLLGHQS